MRLSSILDRSGRPVAVCNTSVADADGINAGWNAYLNPSTVGWYGTLEGRIVGPPGMIVRMS